MAENWLDRVNWSDDGLVPVVAQEVGSNKILTLAWMNRDALRLTAYLSTLRSAPSSDVAGGAR